ncbi:MAG TPA: ABC transporter permease [Chitinophagaceae bacterium]|nr:ABC transporter permease [Chitinophagaceae bacterium]
MIRNYFKIAWRSLWKNKGYSAINIFGLAIGLSASIFIFLWVYDEFSYDQFHSNSNRIFKVFINNKYPDGKIETYPATPAKLKDVIKNEIPEVELAAQYSMETELLVKHETNTFNENGIYADSTLFNILSFPIVNGNATEPLKGNNTIAISKSLAEKLFKNEDPIGKILSVGTKYDLLINSVFADIPQNSTLRFEFVIPFELYVKENPWMQNWKSGGTRTVVMLKSSAVTNQANNKLINLIKKNCSDCSTTPFLFPYTESRLYSEFENGKKAGGRIQQVFLFSVVAILILLMACINFMNLSTARSANRSREVGVRKSIGAQKSHLIVQFIGEALFLSIIAMVFAIVMVKLLLPFFNDVTRKSIQLNLGDPVFVVGILSITIVAGVLAGSYPAFILSRFNPVKVLKGATQPGLSGNALRKFLVVVQFTASIILIVGSVAVYKQISFISGKNLGFNKDNIIVIDQNEGIVKNYEAIKNALQQLPAVKNVAFGGNNIFTIPITTTDPVWSGKPNNSSITFKIYRCDTAFIPAMNIQILEGRNFIGKNDASNYIINKKAMETMGLSLENAVGTELEMWNGKGRIIGITNDFHNDNLKFGIQPLIFMYSENVGSHYFIKVSGGSPMPGLITQIGQIFKENNPDYPFEYTFLEDVFNREYRAEAVIGKLSLSFTVIAIVISCLGLLGLATFTAERRTKELGIRKVMGASVGNLAIMLCSEFTNLIILSLLIGLPISWYLVKEYFSGYMFHTEMKWSIYIITSVSILLIAILSVGYQAIKAAIANPVKSLKTE